MNQFLKGWYAPIFLLIVVAVGLITLERGNSVFLAVDLSFGAAAALGLVQPFILQNRLYETLYSIASAIAAAGGALLCTADATLPDVITVLLLFAGAIGLGFASADHRDRIQHEATGRSFLALWREHPHLVVAEQVLPIATVASLLLLATAMPLLSLVVVAGYWALTPTLNQWRQAPATA